MCGSRNICKTIVGNTTDLSLRLKNNVAIADFRKGFEKGLQWTVMNGRKASTLGRKHGSSSW